jgi:hypothetical protein
MHESKKNLKNARKHDKRRHNDNGLSVILTLQYYLLIYAIIYVKFHIYSQMLVRLEQCSLW